MHSALILALATGLSAVVGFGAGRWLHEPALPAPLSVSQPKAASQFAAVIGPVFRDVLVPQAESAPQALPALPNQGYFRFDTLTIPAADQPSAAGQSGAAVQHAQAAVRHALAGHIQRQAAAWVVTVEQCDGQAVRPSQVVTWTPNQRPGDDLGRLVDAAMRTVLRLDAAAKPDDSQITVSLADGTRLLVPVSAIRDGRYSASLRDGLDECSWTPAGIWTSRLLISAREATHATAFRLTNQREMPQ